MAVINAKIPELKLTHAHLLDKSVMMYGPSKTGKTVCVKDCIEILRGHIDQILVVAPSEPTNLSYAGIVPPPLIHYRLALSDAARRQVVPPGEKPKKLTEKQAAIEFLEAIWNRQEMMAAIYKRASNIKTLGELYKRLPRDARREGDAVFEDLAAKRKGALTRIARQVSGQGTRSEKEAEIKEKFEKMVVLVYKKYITPHVSSLQRAASLSEDERYALAYLHFNPRLLLIFDDCAAQLKGLFGCEVWRKLYYQNRHSYITIILCFQDDTDLNANLRKNAFFSVFTEQIVCNAFFVRPANQIPKPRKDFIIKNAAKILQGHQKLVYIRDDPTNVNIYRYTPPVHEKKMFGSPAFQGLCKEVQASDTVMDIANPYHKMFKV